MKSLLLYRVYNTQIFVSTSFTMDWSATVWL